LFFASGISHISGADERLAMLQAGDTLGLRDDTLNPKNARAILLDARGGQEVGWVPDWLVDEIHAMRDSASKLAITVARVNLGAPAHLRLLCQIEAEEPPR
jgi:hypothetical protein